MNDEHKAIIVRAIERGQVAIKELELKRGSTDVSAKIESYKQELEMLKNEEFMDGFFESWESIKRGDPGTPGKELKRKYKRA